MGRLTYKNPDGTWGLNNGYDIKKVPSELYGALCKLKYYEDTGLNPEQIIELAEHTSTYAGDNGWIPVSERLPKKDDYILVSFSNYSLPDIGRYEEDEEGGAFYPGNEDSSYSSFGVFVNAWQPLPEPYEEGVVQALAEMKGE